MEIHEERLEIFRRFVSFFNEIFKNPDSLQNASCRSSFKDYVYKYYAKDFGVGVEGMSSRHFKWLRKMEPILALPKGATIVDIGGGYGLDSIILSLFGYSAVLYEISPHHLAICEEFQRLWEKDNEPLSIRRVLRAKTGIPTERLARNVEAVRIVDAVLLKEVAHHIEPVEEVFEFCARIIAPGGHIFLVEPNFWNPAVQAFFIRVRGFKTVAQCVDEDTGEPYLHGLEHIRPAYRWKGIIEKSGFRLISANYMVPYLVRGQSSLHAPWRHVLETTPLLKSVAASHITFKFVKCVGGRCL